MKWGGRFKRQSVGDNGDEGDTTTDKERQDKILIKKDNIMNKGDTEGGTSMNVDR